MKRIRQTVALALLAVSPLLIAGEEPAAPRVTVSGISSGAYLATQAHIALSGTIDGAALLAGGPYHCAEGDISKALGRCIGTNAVDVAPLVDYARASAKLGLIDSLGELTNDRVWLFRGQADAVVSAAVTAAAKSFYEVFVRQESISLVDEVPVTHGWPTLTEGAPCGEMGGAYLNACGYDAAGALLQHLYGPLAERVEARDEGFRALPQSGIVPAGGSFAEEGFAYVPAACEERPGDCRLHVAFHGCRQGAQFVEDAFARGAGLNEWAEANDIVVLYPQIESSMFNPQGCWDWWGYTGADYDLRTGKQIAGVGALIEAWSN